ncbi:MAG: dihydropteroate synthase [Bacteroidales bacterium]|nr:dihydropteroate synthase [Bacteroidales bacterium]
MEFKDTFFSRKLNLNCGGRLLDLSEPRVMGILNVTPDSFYDGKRYTTKEAIQAKTQQIFSEGASFIDIGGYSSRPGAANISVEEEFKRLAMALEIVRTEYPEVIISVDTFRSSIARRVVKDFSVDIINDISAGELDTEMFATIAELQVPYIIMHMKGNPQNMQDSPAYTDILKEIFMYFSKKIQILNKLGVNDIILDPGFGFGKTTGHNYRILNQLIHFEIFELPLMVGLSRKSMIYKILENTPDDALNGTTVLNTLALLNGAHILRVHDVKQAIEAIALVKQYIQAGESETE